MKTLNELLASSKLLVLPALLAPLCLLAPASPQLVGVIPAPTASGAFRPGDIVNLEGLFTSNSVGQLFSVYNVPADKWFVLTDYDIGFAGGGADFDLYERDVFGNLTAKRSQYSGLSYSSTVGLAFRPGSQVVLRSGAAFTQAFYGCMGYLANP